VAQLFYDPHSSSVLFDLNPPAKTRPTNSLLERKTSSPNPELVRGVVHARTQSPVLAPLHYDEPCRMPCFSSSIIHFHRYIVFSSCPETRLAIDQHGFLNDLTFSHQHLRH
jgi:hypothetical protein